MTKKELSQLYYLNKEIETLKKQVEILESKCTSTTAVLTDMPKGGVSKDLLNEYVMLKQLMDLRLKECVVKKQNIEKFIQTIDNSTTRQIFTLRHIDGLNWEEISMQIGYSRMQVSRIYNSQIKMLHNVTLK